MRKNQLNPQVPAILAVCLAITGSTYAYLATNSINRDWVAFFHIAFWILIGCSILSFLSAWIKLTWYNAFLAILSSLLLISELAFVAAYGISRLGVTWVIALAAWPLFLIFWLIVVIKSAVSLLRR